MVPKLSKAGYSTQTWLWNVALAMQAKQVVPKLSRSSSTLVPQYLHQPQLLVGMQGGRVVPS